MGFPNRTMTQDKNSNLSVTTKKTIWADPNYAPSYTISLPWNLRKSHDQITFQLGFNNIHIKQCLA